MKVSLYSAVVLASNIHTCQVEIDSIEQWVRANNLRVNPSNYAEIVFHDSHLRIKVQPPPALPDIKQVRVIRILRVTFTNSLSVVERVHDVMCADTVHLDSSACTRDEQHSPPICQSGSRHPQQPPPCNARDVTMFEFDNVGLRTFLADSKFSKCFKCFVVRC